MRPFSNSAGANRMARRLGNLEIEVIKPCDIFKSRTISPLITVHQRLNLIFYPFAVASEQYLIVYKNMIPPEFDRSDFEITSPVDGG
jgi:hypothetical protein